MRDRSQGRRYWFFRGVSPVERATAARDVLAGFTLAAMSIPQALGYTRIAGMPVVTGLYALMLPLVAFATFGSSRYLVVAADSATAAIIADRLSELAPIASAHYVALAGMVALLAAVFLLLARVFRLGFLADFLSQTVLVGFLTGVGLQVGIAMLGDMLGVPISSNRTITQLMQLAHGLPRLHLPTLSLAAAVAVFLFILHRRAPRWPAPLLVVLAAIAASAAFDFAAHGIAHLEHVSRGLPPLALPAVGLEEIRQLLPTATACFFVIVAQSVATARAYASRHREPLDENADFMGLAAANIVAGLSGTFVVNGSPTQTAMVESAGGQSQLTHLTTAVVVALVLLFFTEPLSYLPRCVLAAIVFVIGLELIDVTGLREIRGESPGEFALALITAAMVVTLGVDQGILLAIVLSLFRHVRHSYSPPIAVLIEEDGHWRPIPATPGAVSAPGLLVFQFSAELFYANAGRFVAAIRELITATDTPLEYLVIDAGAITTIDFSAARMVRDLERDLTSRGIRLLLVHAEPSLLADLRRHRLSDVIGAEQIFDTLREALQAIRVRSAD